ncbi:2-oxoacid:acceptor oxidoreductase subunit alpha, partial [Candidatus Peregrinibacteria bacterium]|nr:2-oxoacid:acceptor oxidoreductase subunit alpha [Candidatus Peregrinibacteria bacterium]
VAIGAIKAGLKYVGEYPMTPSSSILHLTAKWAEKYGIVVKQPEDEIAACNSVIGAGFAGARSMAATSGGGYALMTEAIGLAGMNEVPIVVVVVMRPGPATGLPTRSEQGDLRQVIHGGQGDPVKIVLLPGDVQESFKFAFEAFNLAEKYQMPVIICYDKHMGEGYFTIPPFDESGMKVERGKLLSQKELDEIDDYKRYLRTDDGISPRVIPGMKGGIHRATSDEHNEYGDIFEDAENRKLMVEKRLKKVELAKEDTFKPMVIGENNADITFVTWGSCKGICLEAVQILDRKGIKANILQIRTAWPFHTDEVKKELEGCKRPVLVEHNFTGQLGGLIAEHTGILIGEKVLRYDGRPMTAKYVLDGIGINHGD